MADAPEPNDGPRGRVLPDGRLDDGPDPLPTDIPDSEYEWIDQEMTELVRQVREALRAGRRTGWERPDEQSGKGTTPASP